MDHPRATHPRRDERLEVLDASAPTATIVYAPASGRYVRVGAAELAVLEHLDGGRSLDELRAAPPADLAPEQVDRVVDRFGELGLLAGPDPSPDPSGRPPPRAGRRRGTRLHLLDPGPLLDRCAPLTRALLGTRGAAVAIVVGAGALAVLATSRAELAAAALRPPPPAVAVALAVTMLVLTAVHELAHAAVLHHLGGRARSMGVMVLHGIPMAYCDVTDVWRLPRRPARVAVALAGPAVHAGVAAAALVAHPLAGPHLGDGARQWLALVVAANLALAAWNLCPLVKLDGYWALSAGLGLPNLRPRATAYLGGWLARLVAGAPPPRRPGARPAAWLAFGVACTAFTPLVVVVALGTYRDALVGAGPVGAAVWLALVAALAAGAARRLARWRDGAGPMVTAPRARLVAVGATVAGAAALAALGATPADLAELADGWLGRPLDVVLGGTP